MLSYGGLSISVIALQLESALQSAISCTSICTQTKTDSLERRVSAKRLSMHTRLCVFVSQEQWEFQQTLTILHRTSME